MISLRVFLFVTLSMTRLDYVRGLIWWNSTVTFVYMDGDKLDIYIMLQNVPLTANYYVIYYQTENCDKYFNEKYNQQGSQCQVPEKNGTIPTDRLIHTTQKLNKQSVTLSIELGNSNEICPRKKIAEGIRGTNADNAFRTDCLNHNAESHNRRCEIIVDFENKCEAGTSPEGNDSLDARQTQVTSSSLKPEAPQSQQPKEMRERERKSNLGQPSSDKTKYYIGIALVAGIIVLMSLIYVVIQKCYRKSCDPDQTLQLETCASTNGILYVELDIRTGNAPTPARTEDPTYAEIIGEVRPQDNKK